MSQKMLPLTLVLLACAVIPFVILLLIRKRKQDGWMYFLASLSILFLTAAVLAWAPAAYDKLGGMAFFPTPAEGSGGFDTQSYSGFLQILFGVPVAVAGSLYAILLARQSERQSSQFNEYEIQKSFRDRLERRNAIFGRFAQSLRDINNTSYVLKARLDQVVGALPEDDAERAQAAERIRIKADGIDAEGLGMLRAALQEYRSATNAFLEGGIALDTRPANVLSAIWWHFYPDKVLKDEPFVASMLRRDYQAVADRLLVRAHRLNATDLVRAHLERLAFLVVRWSEDDDVAHDTLDLYQIMMSRNDESRANVSGESDYVGFRFIGPALIRADECVDRRDGSPLKYRIDFGTAFLLDSYLALPDKKLSQQEIETWHEWKYLKKALDQGSLDTLSNTILEPDKHFARGFDRGVKAVETLYDYAPVRTEQIEEGAGSEIKVRWADATPAQEARARRARLEHNALFHVMPPRWLDAVYESLALDILGATPPTRRELVDQLAFLAVGIELARIDGARSSGMVAVNLLLKSMHGAVERQFFQLGATGQHELRRCLLVSWAHNEEPGQRGAIVDSLLRLLAMSTDTVLTVRLHLDLSDCYRALHDDDAAARHFATAKGMIDALPVRELVPLDWFGAYKPKDAEQIVEPQIVLFSVWLCGFLMKQPGDFLFGGKPLSEVEITMPIGFLPLIWLWLIDTGVLRLPPGAEPRLRAWPDDSFFDKVIEPGQGAWTWDAAVVARQVAQSIARARQPGAPPMLDLLFDRCQGSPGS